MGAKRTKEKRKTADKPSFDEAALAQLTSKLDKSLGDSEKQRPPKRKRQRENDDEHEPKRHQPRPSERGIQGQEGSGGGRRSRQVPSLLDEILALGGDEEDLELVANVDSGDEGGDAPRPKVSSETVVDKSLKDELARFASSLGLNNFHENEDPETDEDVDEEEEEDFESVEDSEAEEERAAVAQPPAQEVRQGKTSGKLVSEQPCTVPLAAEIDCPV